MHVIVFGKYTNQTTYFNKMSARANVLYENRKIVTYARICLEGVQEGTGGKMNINMPF